MSLPLFSQKLANKKKAGSTQLHLDIAEIKEEVVVLKNGALRAILMVSSMNFALKSEDEQKAIIYAFQEFLNSLDFPIQIVIHSRKLDVDPYLAKLEEREREQTNELLRIQTEEYRDYIQKLIDIANVMTKNFFIVVPFALGEKKEKPWDKLIAAIKQSEVIRYKREGFEKHKTELLRRVDHVISGLGGVGLKCALLDTQELIGLFYNIYNPETSRQEDLPDMEELALEGESDLGIPQVKQ